MSKLYTQTLGNETISTYFREIRKSTVLTSEEEVELAIKIKNGDKGAIDKLVTSNLKFVISIAKEYQGQGLALGDLINEGNLGLVKAATRYDHTRGFRFISYAVWWIRQSIIQSLNENSRTIRLPSNVIIKLANTKKEFDKFQFENEREADMVDFQGDEGIVEISKLPKCSSLNVRVNEEGSELYQLIEDKNADTEIFSDTKDLLKVELNNILDKLSEREREIIKSYFGIDRDCEGMTLEAIGEKYDLTKERIRQIKQNALRKLRHNANNLFDILDE